MIDDNWAKAQTNFPAKVITDELNVYRVLKNPTTGEARKVVVSVKGENSFRAWQKLHMRFGPSLASKQGMVLMDISTMVARPAKTPEQTRNLITEMEKKTKAIKNYQDALNLLEERYKIDIEKLDKKEKEELLIVIEEHKESPEGLAEEMRKLFGINNE